MLGLDEVAASALAVESGADLALVGPAVVHFDPVALPFRSSAFDSVVLCRPPDDHNLAFLMRCLRPGGRLIARVAQSARASLLDRLGQAGFLHLYAEAVDGWALVRGERPPEGLRPVDRIAAVTGGRAGPGGLRLIDPGAGDLPAVCRYVHVLIAQTPNKPAWRLAPEDRVEWRAAVAAPADLPLAAPAFTSLVKAVRFMQAAVLAGAIRGVNKVGKFPAAAARAWPFGLVLDVDFEEWRAGPWAASGWQWQAVDWQAAVHDES